MSEFDYKKILKVDGLDLSGLDELGQAPLSEPEGGSFTGWSEEASLYLSEGEYERFVLRSGGVRFDGRVRGDFSLLDWDAEIPKELKPGQSFDDIYDKFLPLIVTSLPNKMMLGLNSMEQTTLRYRKYSQIILGYRSGYEEKHRIDTEKDTAKFALSFLDREDRIARMRIIAGLGDSDYTLNIRYGRGSDRDTMELLLPVNSRGVQSYTGNAAEWVLSTHSQRANLGANLATPAARLADIMKSKMSDALTRKEQRGQI